MKDSTRRNVEQQIRINNARGKRSEAHLRASVVNQAYGSWAKLLTKHSNILANDIQKLYPDGIKVVIDNDLGNRD